MSTTAKLHALEEHAVPSATHLSPLVAAVKALPPAMVTKREGWKTFYVYSYTHIRCTCIVENKWVYQINGEFLWSWLSQSWFSLGSKSNFYHSPTTFWPNSENSCSSPKKEDRQLPLLSKQCALLCSRDPLCFWQLSQSSGMWEVDDVCGIPKPQSPDAHLPWIMKWVAEWWHCENAR